ncbi:hypothetical protein RFI_16446 [Reticulomyxa filosa]|uniref:Uncharacterized protein n=1 Tax=Reticulomyxa filosa TaxID=46433 RepID=X6N634_RETFI|nr:hypothetical protein RFI_16446 [Reticulomyxa filosa]|eukprot:ETO20772.1 hypothetical protein RFI_16446 [Reticulomyxa filosa]
MTGCQRGLKLFEARMDWHKVTDILAFESMREHMVQKELPYRLCHPLYHASWFASFTLILAIIYIAMLVNNFSAFLTQPTYIAIKLGRNILAVLVILYSLIYFQKFADLHAFHSENHRKLLRKCIVDLQVEKLKLAAHVEMIKSQISQNDPAASEQAIRSAQEQIEEYERMARILKKMQEFQEGLDPYYAIRVFGYQVKATPALVSAITGSIGAYLAVIFSLFVNNFIA